MLLTKENSLCEKNQAIIVSKDQRSRSEHRAINPERKYDVRQYRLDGGVFRQSLCCDYLLVNDSTEKAYLIELKGSDIEHAIEQLKAGEEKCRAELEGYLFFYRLIPSKVRTHAVNGTKVRKFMAKHSARFKMQNNSMEEILA